MGQTTQALQQVPIYLHQYPLQAETFVPQSQVTEPQGFMLLPLELVILIAQQLSDNGKTRDLAAFARLLPRNICYTRAIQQVLFGHITIQSYEQYVALTRTLQHGSTQTRCLELSSMIHNVSAVLDTQPRSGGQQFLSRHLLNLYDQCSQLKRITLLGPPDDRRSEHIIPDVEDLYHIETFQTIESLTLTCPLSFLGPSLLSNLPCLKELHIVGGPVLLRMSNITPRSGPYLRCLKWSAETPPTLQVVKWLFAGSTEATGGTITLLTPGTSESELELIRQYALSRKMDFYTQVALNPIYAET